MLKTYKKMRCTLKTEWDWQVVQFIEIGGTRVVVLSRYSPPHLSAFNLGSAGGSSDPNWLRCEKQAFEYASQVNNVANCNALRWPVAWVLDEYVGGWEETETRYQREARYVS